MTKDMEGTTDIGSLTDKEKKMMYAQRALILSRLGRMQEADEAYRAWLAIGDTYMIISDYSLPDGQKAL